MKNFENYFFLSIIFLCLISYYVVAMTNPTAGNYKTTCPTTYSEYVKDIYTPVCAENTPLMQSNNIFYGIARNAHYIFLFILGYATKKHIGKLYNWYKNLPPSNADENKDTK